MKKCPQTRQGLWEHTNSICSDKVHCHGRLWYGEAAMQYPIKFTHIYLDGIYPHREHQIRANVGHRLLQLSQPPARMHVGFGIGYGIGLVVPGWPRPPSQQQITGFVSRDPLWLRPRASDEEVLDTAVAENDCRCSG